METVSNVVGTDATSMLLFGLYALNDMAAIFSAVVFGRNSLDPFLFSNLHFSCSSRPVGHSSVFIVLGKEDLTLT